MEIKYSDSHPGTNIAKMLPGTCFSYAGNLYLRLGKVDRKDKNDHFTEGFVALSNGCIDYVTAGSDTEGLIINAKVVVE